MLLVTSCNPTHYNIGSFIGSIELGQMKNVYAYMLSDEGIHEWWSTKIENYIKIMP